MRPVRAAVAVQAALLAAVATPLYWTRPWADDFCLAARALDRGVLGAQASWYHDWSGRITATLVGTAGSLLPGGLVWLVAAAVLAAWVAALAWAVAQLLARRLDGLCAGLALTVVLVSLVVAPSREQSTQWLSGLVTYLLPLVLGALVTGLVARALRRGSSHVALVVAAFVVAALASGCDETYAVMQTTALLLVAAAVLGARRIPLRRGGAVLAGATAGSLAGAVVVALSPGNAVRAAALGNTRHLTDAFVPTLQAMGLLFKYALVQAPVSLAVAVAVPMLLALTSASGPSAMPSRRTVAAAVLGLFAVLYAAFAPSLVLTGQVPAPRLVFLPLVALTVALAIAGWAMGRALGATLHTTPARPPLLHAVLAAATAAALAGGPGVAAVHAVTDETSTVRAAAAAWDRRDATLEAAHAHGDESATTVDITPPPDLQDFSDPGVRGCAATVYGLRLAVR